MNCWEGIFALHNAPNTEVLKHTCMYHIVALFGACAYSRKTMFSYYSKLPVCLYSSRGACSLTGVCAKKRDNTVMYFSYFLLVDTY